MATFDSADLLDRLYTKVRRPTTDEHLTSTLGYQLLSEAQIDAAQDLVTRAPQAMMGAPLLLTSADSGVTYTFGTTLSGARVFPVGHVEVYALIDGQELYASTYGDREGDFVIEGDAIRMPGNTARTFASGPYARACTIAITLDGSTAPTLKPEWLRPLIVTKAAEKYARIGGLMDERPFTQEYQMDLSRALLTLKTQFKNRNSPASLRSRRRWWETLDTNT